tara:strand:+ start:499 stop:1761 length:1263 start_codon:yes stop_codon:yes gene_type:complete
MNLLDQNFNNKSNVTGILASVSIFLLFFPSITFSIINAEVFPWGILIILVYKLRLDYRSCILIFFMFISILLGALFRNEIDFEVIRSFAAYLNVILVSSFIVHCNDKTLIKIIGILKVVLIVLLSVGILQVTNALSFAEPVFEFLIRRGSVSSLDGSERGIRLLSSEPSRAAMELIFIYGALRVIGLFDKFSIIADLVIISFLLFFIKSITGLIFMGLFFSVIYPKLIVLSLFLIPSFIYLVPAEFINSRALSLLINVAANSSLDNFFELSLKLSGFRFPSVISSYLFGLEYPFGGGIGQWMYSSVQALNGLGIEAGEIDYFRTEFNSTYVPVRPTSFLASISLDMGLFGCLITSYWIAVGLFKKRLHHKVLPVFMIFIVYLLLIGEIGNPVPWVCMLASLEFLNRGINRMPGNVKKIRV